MRGQNALRMGWEVCESGNLRFKNKFPSEWILEWMEEVKTISKGVVGVAENQQKGKWRGSPK